ncbi:glycosyltransferase family 4 protein [Candidatus Ruminimicrobium bovinum]|uniref:glycosyltransferase family 4 protein n=1 Tax=Candidatus Ruminimicrobium bovinum TaxID=3242779 RepID=UPI0039B9559B
MKKKVAVIITKLELGGAQKVAIALCEKINKELFDTFMICGCDGILSDEVKQQNKVYFVKNLIREINPIKDLKAAISIYKILKKEKPDVIHTHSSKAGILGRVCGWLAGIPVIIHTTHGFSFNDTQSFFKKNLFIFLERFCAIFSTYLIFISKENIDKGIKNKIGKQDKYKFIRLGIDIDNFKNFQNPSLRRELNLSNDDILVTTIGPFKPQKNLPDFIKVANKISKEHKNFKFVMVGDGTLRPEFESLIEKYNIKENIFLLGWRRDIANVLHSSDFFVMTSLWEGLPISTIEAMTCGLAPIVNAVDGQKEIVKDGINGFLIPPYNIDETCYKILYLAENPEIKSKMEREAKNSIDETYGIEYMIKQHELLYNALKKR